MLKKCEHRKGHLSNDDEGESEHIEHLFFSAEEDLRVWLGAQCDMKNLMGSLDVRLVIIASLSNTNC